MKGGFGVNRVSLGAHKLAEYFSFCLFQFVIRIKKNWVVIYYKYKNKMQGVGTPKIIQRRAT